MADGIYCKMNANDPSFIHFPHIRTGDREGILDTDFSIKKGLIVQGKRIIKNHTDFSVREAQSTRLTALKHSL